jgi:hypothetical protein
VDQKVEMSAMAELFLPPLLSSSFPFVLVGYLVGDLVSQMTIHVFHT